MSLGSTQRSLLSSLIRRVSSLDASTADFLVSTSIMLMCPLQCGKDGGGRGKAEALERRRSRVDVVTGGGGEGMQGGEMLPASLYFLLSM